MSFVDLMKDDVWSEVDIVNRTETIIRATFTHEEESILNRKVTGMLLGKYTMTADEQAELAQFNSLVVQARTEGDSARTDNASLQSVLAYEAIYIRHARLAAQPLSDDPDVAHDQTVTLENLQAQIDATDATTKTLADTRGRCKAVDDEIAAEKAAASAQTTTTP